MNIALLLLALTSLSTSGLWVRMAMAPIAVICAWRLFGAAIMVSVPSLVRRQSLVWQSRQEGYSSLAAGVFFFAHLWTYVFAAQNTSIAHLVLIFSSAPLFTALGARLWFHEKFPAHLYVVYVLAGIGIYLLFTDPLRATTARSLATSFEGDLAALVSALLHTFYSLAGKQARQIAPNFRFSFWLYFISGILFLLLGTVQQQNFLPESTYFWGAILGLIVFPSLLGHTLYTYLLRFVNINVLSCSKLIEPAIAAGLAYLYFDEEVGPKTLVAFVLMATAVVVLFRPWRAANTAAASVSDSKSG